MAVVVTYRYAYYKHNGSGQLTHTTFSDISVQSLKFAKIATVEATQGKTFWTLVCVIWCLIWFQPPRSIRLSYVVTIARPSHHKSQIAAFDGLSTGITYLLTSCFDSSASSQIILLLTYQVISYMWDRHFSHHSCRPSLVLHSFTPGLKLTCSRYPFRRRLPALFAVSFPFIFTDHFSGHAEQAGSRLSLCEMFVCPDDNFPTK